MRDDESSAGTAEQQLERSLSLLQSTLDSTADGILVVDDLGRIATFNRRFAEMWRLPAEIVESGDDERALAFAVGQLSHPEAFSDKVRELYQNPEDESFDVLEFKDGRVFERYSQPQRLADRIVGRVWSFRDVTEQRQAQRDARRADRERRKLLAHLVQAQEAERRRIAADIHDDSVQIMTAARMRLDVLRRRLPPEYAGEVAEVEVTVEHAIDRLRALLFDLRPVVLDMRGLGAAVEVLLDNVRSEIGAHTTLEDGLLTEPEPEQQMILYLIAHEALANVRKHSGAANVRVELEPREEGVQLRVSDDGRGFDPRVSTHTRVGHLGLIAMRERAELAGGRCNVMSEAGTGALLEAWIPCPMEIGD